jgi:hypothetical protein
MSENVVPRPSRSFVWVMNRCCSAVWSSVMTTTTLGRLTSIVTSAEAVAPSLVVTVNPNVSRPRNPGAGV